MKSFKENTMKEKKMLPVGTKVFDVQLGWGKVVGHSESTNCPLKIKFDDGYIELYAFDGKVSLDDKVPVLSLTEYSLETGGFTPISEYWNKPQIGGWGYFWDNYGNHGIYFGKLIDIDDKKEEPYASHNGVSWNNFSHDIPEHIKQQMNNETDK